MALANGGIRRAPDDQSALPRGERDRKRCRQEDRARRRNQSRAAALRRNHRREPGGEREPPTAAEREVERRREQRSHHGRAGAHQSGFVLGHHAERQHEPDSGDEGERVPVSKRRAQLFAGGIPIGEPSCECVTAEDGAPRDHPEHERDRRSAR